MTLTLLLTRFPPRLDVASTHSAPSLTHDSHGGAPVWPRLPLSNYETNTNSRGIIPLTGYIWISSVDISSKLLISA